MKVSFKTQLKLNNKQKTMLAKHAGVARHAWNWGLDLVMAILEHNKANQKDKIKFPTAIDLHKWLVALVKPKNEWYYEVSKCAPQQALRNLSTALSDFFKGKKIRGKRVGFPRFKKKGKSDSFYLEGTIKVDNHKIQVPRIGWIKTYERLPQGLQPKSVTISRHASEWYISFCYEIETKQTVKKVETVGVDLGVKVLATLSTGEVFSGAKSYRKLEKKLSRLQWLNRHRQKGSNNQIKAYKKIAKLHKRIADIRQDVLHKITTYLAKNHGIIVIEDLNVAGMLANHKLVKAIQDMGFYEFRRQLEYKCEMYQSQLIVVDRFYPSSKTCSNCGVIKDKLPLSERIFNCLECDLNIDRDLNASINLSQYPTASSVVEKSVGLSKRRRSQSEADR